MKKLLFILIATVAMISCEKDPNLKNYGKYDVIGCTYESDECGIFENGNFVYPRTVKVVFDEHNIEYYESGELKETQPYLRESKEIIKYTSTINGNVIIEVYATKEGDYFILYDGDKNINSHRGAGVSLMLMKKQ